MFLRQVFDPQLAQYAYLIGCQQTGEAVVIDPERDVDRYLELAAAEGLRITAAAETHIHADFLSGARELGERGAKLYLSAEGGEDWSYRWTGDRAGDGDYDVTLLADGDRFQVGKIEIQAVHTPGHTPEHLSFRVTDHGGGAGEPMGIVTGDFVFVGDLGRPDLLETAAGQAGARDPSARSLYRSLPRFLELPEFLQVWPAHGAGSACGKALGAVPMSTVGYEKRYNTALAAGERGEEAFVEAILAGQPEPPLYFARMKRLNRDGPPLLGALPRPPRVGAAELAEAALRDGRVVLDTRLDRRAFMAGHLPGSLYAPLDKSFPTVAGSYVGTGEDIFLLVEAADDGDGEAEDRVEEAVRALVRIGLDRIAGWAPAAELEPAAELAGGLSTIPVIDFAEVERRRGEEGFAVLDVRGAAEHAAGHVPGSLNVAHTRLRARLDDVPDDRELLVHCRTGTRAAYAAAMLERAGRRVRYVDGAFADWRQGGATPS